MDPHRRRRRRPTPRAPVGGEQSKKARAHCPAIDRKGTYQAPAGPPALKGEVVATQPAETIAAAAAHAVAGPACCYDNCNCAPTCRCAAMPLVRPCLWAEAAEYLQVDTLRSPQDAECCQPCCCCTSARCATNYWALMGYSCATSLAQSLCNAMGCQSISSMINLTPLLTMRSRQQLEEQGLAVECGHAYCADYWCFPCSAYQQGSTSSMS